jgi:hypothetical protein
MRACTGTSVWMRTCLARTHMLNARGAKDQVACWPSNEPCVARGDRFRRQWRPSHRVGTGVDERVSMLVQKLSLRWWRLCRALWYLRAHTHCVQSRQGRLLLFSDGREDQRRPSPSPSPRSVCMVPRCRVHPENVNHLSMARHPTALAL